MNENKVSRVLPFFFITFILHCIINSIIHHFFFHIHYLGLFFKFLKNSLNLGQVQLPATHHNIESMKTSVENYIT